MTAPSDARDQRIEQLFARFSQRPADPAVFEELESELRAAERFLHLAGAYEVRLQSISDVGKRADLLVKLAGVLEQQLNAPRAALKRLKDARALVPQRADVLRSLRRLLVRQGDGMAALQIAEAEESLNLSTLERAELLVETASLWRALSEPTQARARLEEALRIVPEHPAALMELAELDGSAPAAAPASEGMASAVDPAAAPSQQAQPSASSPQPAAPSTEESPAVVAAVSDSLTAHVSTASVSNGSSDSSAPPDPGHATEAVPTPGPTIANQPHPAASPAPDALTRITEPPPIPGTAAAIPPPIPHRARRTQASSDHTTPPPLPSALQPGAASAASTESQTSAESQTASTAPAAVDSQAPAGSPARIASLANTESRTPAESQTAKAPRAPTDSRAPVESRARNASQATAGSQTRTGAATSASPALPSAAIENDHARTSDAPPSFGSAASEPARSSEPPPATRDSEGTHPTLESVGSTALDAALSIAGEDASAMAGESAVAATHAPSPTAEELARSVERCAATGDLDGWIAALTALDSVCGPERDRALQLAELHELKGNARGSADALERWLTLGADDAAVLTMLDRSLRVLGETRRRCEIFERRIALRRSDSEGARLYMALGALCAEELGDSEGAERAYRGALALCPGDEAPLARLQDLLLSAARHGAWIELLTQSSEALGCGALAAAFARRAADHAVTHDGVDRARALYLRALAADPEDRAAVAGLRRLASEHADRIAQRAACEAELRLGSPEGVSDAARLERERCELALEDGDLDTARNAALRWCEAEPGIDAWRALTTIARTAGRLEHERDALESLEALVADDAERAACRTRLGEIAEQGPGPLATPNACRWYREALELEPLGPARNKLVDLYRRCNRHDDLIRLLQSEIDGGVTANPTAVRIELAQVLRELGDPARAAQALLPAFSADPSHRECADLLEALLAQADDVETYASVLDRRMHEASDSEQRESAALQLATLYLDRLGRPRDACDILHNRVSPDESGAAEVLYERALAAAQDSELQLAWQQQRAQLERSPERQVARWLELAALQQAAGRLADAVDSLERAEQIVGPQAGELVRRPLLALLQEAQEPERALELLGELGLVARTARARATFVLERARILLELERGPEAMAELEHLPRLVSLDPREWRIVCDLARRAEDLVRLRDALTTLIEMTPESDERQALRLELADLYMSERPEVRDTERGESLLHELLEDPALHEAAAERLAEALIQTGRRRARVELLERRLAHPDLTPAMRRILTLQLAELQLDLGAADDARALLSAERESGGPHLELDRLLCDALERVGDHAAKDALYRERVLSESGPERVHWLRRWLAAQERARATPAARLEVVERWLAFVGSDVELERKRITLLRESGRLESLAHALEDLLATDSRLTSGRQLALIRELLRLYEGSLELPRRALALCERELSRHPELRAEAARLAARIGDGERQRIHLEALLGEHTEDDPRAADWNRQLALLLARQGRSDEARTRLHAALRQAPHDAELLRALEPIERSALTPVKLLELLEVRYGLEPAERRAVIAREAFAIAERVCDALAALRWARRWQLHETLPPDTQKRWLGLERAVGDPAGVLNALGALAHGAQDADLRAQWTAERAALWAERGELAWAQAAYQEAIELSPRRSLPWLLELDRLAAKRGRADERLPLLERISQHADASEAQRARALEQRIEILAAQPDRREQAARELDVLLEAHTGESRTTRMDRLQRLLELYRLLGDTPGWCAAAEQLIAICDPAQAEAIRRELARKLETLAARERAVGIWQGLLAEQPHDLEALAALACLLDRAGEEERRARVLEAWATARGRDGAELWLEAAELRWRKLGDAQAALRAAERALELDPLSFSVHALRAELCFFLDIPSDEEDSLRAMLEAEPSTESAPPRWLRLAELVSTRSVAPDELVETLERALRSTEPGDPTRIQVRHWFARLGRWDQVASLLHEEVSSGGEAAHAALRELARVEWEERGDPAAACAHFERLSAAHALEADDEDRWAHALAALDRTPESLPHRERALEGLGARARGQDWYELARDLLEQHRDETGARNACDRALELDAAHTQALELRVELDHRLGRSQDELEGRLALAARIPDSGRAAAELALASRLAFDLHDLPRAAALAGRALEQDPSCIDALWAAGAAADVLRDPETSERAYGRLSSLLDDAAEARARAARHAARAARALDHTAAAAHYLDVALTADSQDDESLREMLDLSLALGHSERARQCLELQLERGKLTDAQALAARRQLADLCTQLGDFEAAAEALEVALGASDAPHELRGQLLDALVQLGDFERALERSSEWSRTASEEESLQLELRAARIERMLEQSDAARRRLEQLVERAPENVAAWIELAQLTHALEGTSAALELSARALAHLSDEAATAELHWLRAEWLAATDQCEAALSAAGQVLRAAPLRADAASLVARLLERSCSAGSQASAQSSELWSTHAAQLERTLRELDSSAETRAELWFAVGVARVALGDASAACDAFRAALDHNPLHAAARERLADLASEDTRSHSESARLQETLLEAEPTRERSWRALTAIARARARAKAVRTCENVLRTFGWEEGAPEPAGKGLLLSAESPAGHAAATELFVELRELDLLPAADPGFEPTPIGVLSAPVESYAAGAFRLSDAQLSEIASESEEALEQRLISIPRLKRRRARRAHRALQAAGAFDAEAWRIDVLVRAATAEIQAGELSFADGLRALLATCPSTRTLVLDTPERLRSAVACCPAARTLVARTANAILAGIA